MQNDWRQIEEEKKELLNTSIEDDYKKFLDNQGDKVDKEFSELHNFQTNTRGLKIRGSFPTYEEASMRAKLLREKDHKKLHSHLYQVRMLSLCMQTTLILNGQVPSQ